MARSRFSIQKLEERIAPGHFNPLMGMTMPSPVNLNLTFNITTITQTVNNTVIAIGPNAQAFSAISLTAIA
jgi:hypothetical protein